MNRGVTEIMTVNEVAAMLGISPRTVWEQSSCGAMPKPIKIGRKITRWHRQTLEKWLEEKVEIAERERKKLEEIGKI